MVICNIIFLKHFMLIFFSDSIRKSVKYNSIPEKDIDSCLGIWLSHAPFRFKKKRIKKSQIIIFLSISIMFFVFSKKINHVLVIINIYYSNVMFFILYYILKIKHNFFFVNCQYIVIISFLKLKKGIWFNLIFIDTA